MASINYQQKFQEEWATLKLQQKILLLNQIEATRRGLYDSVFFCNYWLGVEVNPFQERVLRILDEALWGGKYKPEDLIEAIMKAGNRSGKTVLLAMIHIKFAFYKIGIEFGSGYNDFKYRTFDISPQSRQAKECLRYIEDILTGRLTWQKNGKRYSNKTTLRLRNFFVGKNENLGEIRYSNRSLTYAFSTGEDMGAGFQGLPAGLVTYDECVLCYSQDTEVLTASGWKKFNEVSLAERVPSLNPINGRVEVATVKQVIWQPYEGDMVWLGQTDKNTDVDFLVTPNHNQLVLPSLGANRYGMFKFVKADSLLDEHFKLINHIIVLSPKNDIYLNHHDKPMASLVSYNGYIGCLRLDKNHTLMVRRNGRIMWSGNSHHLEEELDSNVYSRLGDYGKLMMLVSTPNEEGKSQQYFYHLVSEAKDNKNKYILLEGSYEENIFIPKAKRDSHVKMMKERDPLKANQIIYGDFVSTGSTVFEPQVIEQMFKDMGEPEEPKNEHNYLISVDWGVADKGDETVMLVWDITKLPVKIVYAYSKQGGDPYELMAVLRNMKMNYNEAKVVMDTSSMGGTMFKKLLKDLKPIGFEAGGSGEEKANAIFAAQALLTKNRYKRLVDGRIIEDEPNYGWIRSTYLPKLASQLSTYRLDDKKLKQDWVSSFYIGCWFVWKQYGEKTNSQKGSYPLSRFRVSVPQTIKLSV